MNILITNSAKVEFDKMLENSEIKSIRIRTRNITMHEDAKIDLELDEIKEDDKIFEVDGYKIIINKNLANQMSSITISYGGLLSKNSFSIDADFGFYEY